MRNVKPPPKVKPNLFEPMVQPSKMPDNSSFRGVDLDFDSDVQAEMRRQEQILMQMLKNEQRDQYVSRFFQNMSSYLFILLRGIIRRVEIVASNTRLTHLG